MAGDPNNAELLTYADVYVGPLSAPNPAGIDAPFSGAWGLVGLLDGDDGLPEARDVDTDDKYAWGGILVRTSRAHFKLTKSFSALEDNLTTRALVWPGSTDTEVIVPVPVPVKLAFEVQDKDTGKIERLITRRHAIIDVDGDIAKNETDLTKYQLAAVIYPDADGVLFDRQTAPSLSNIAMSQGTLALDVDEIASLDVTATYSDSSTTVVTSSAEWSSSDPSKATVSAGFVKGIAAGTATITASVGDKSATCTVTVSA